MNKDTLKKYQDLITNYAQENYSKMFREPDGILKHKFIVPGSCYSNCLWDWDSWLTNIALRNISDADDISEYEQGCILNFIEHTSENGEMPINITPDKAFPSSDEQTNHHKPNLAQHALFISEQNNDFKWLLPHFETLLKYIHYYEVNCKHESGLFFWTDDCAIGVDNDPCTFYRPPKSSASIFLNCLMYKELCAISIIADNLGQNKLKIDFYKKSEELKTAIIDNCWDERDGFYYSVDINLIPIDKNSILHSGCPRHWNTLIQRIDVWSGFLAMWAGIATKEQAKRMVNEHLKNDKTFNAPYGIRTLSKLEKMYSIIKSGNPSCWLGPIWGISNYMVFEGLVKYGFTSEAYEIAEKTIKLFGQDIEKCGELHEYYDPDTGEGVNNPGFQNWNLLSVNMIKWMVASNSL